MASANTLSMSTDQIFKFIDNNTNLASLPEAQIKIKAETTARKDDELLIISKNPVCSIKKLDKDSESLINLNAEALKKVLHDNFYNASVLAESLCVAESIFYGDSHNTGLAKNMKIRHWIKNLHQIGAESVAGYALLAGVSDANDVFIIKVPRNSNDDDLQHELFVGLFCTNTLRAVVPNFSYIFGGFRCSPPVVGNKGETINIFCNEDLGTKNVNYILYEKITPNISMKEYVKTCRGIDFLNKYLQIIYALRIAYNKYEFTHYDLHSDNVLIWDILKLPSAIPYPTDKGIEYLLTDKVATLIDYGNAFVNYNGKPYGVYTLPNYGISGTSGFPMYDAYKLLGFCMYDMLEAKNMECFNVASRILRFFNSTEDLVSLITTQRSALYILPPDSAFKTVTYDAFITYIRSSLDLDTSFIVTNPYKTPILQCGYDGVCLTSASIVKEIGLDTYKIPDNFYDFYDLSMHYSKEKKAQEFQKLFTDFKVNYEVAKSKLLDEIKTNTDIIKSLAVKLISPYISSYKDALTPETLNLFKIFTFNTMKVFEAFYNLRILEQLFTNVIVLYEQPENQTILKDKTIQVFTLYNQVIPLYTYLSDASKTISNLVNLLYNNTNASQRADIRQIITANPQFTWYLKDLVSYSAILRAQIY